VLTEKVEKPQAPKKNWLGNVVGKFRRKAETK
jgi:hypothetical protein